MTPLDSFDLAILRILQKNNQTPQREIGEAVNLSAPSVQRRIRRMEADGVIRAQVAQIAPEAIDAVKERFRAAPEVQQCRYVTGEADFILVVIVASMAAYEDFTRRMFFDGANIKKFRTMVSMGEVKTGIALNI
jgi:Lrp/AsnC family transcriptional regulator, leucine-responsive regulatory protein